jgi:Glycosyltransferase like family 2
VVLDGDVDGSYPYVKGLTQEFPLLRPVLVEQGGQMRALDEGVSRSSGDVVLLMDDDVIAGPGLVSGHALAHRGRAGLVVMGYMPVKMVERGVAQTRLYAKEYEAHCARIEAGQLTVLEGLWLGNVSARRADLASVGISTERFPLRWHADLDLGLRLAQAGAVGVFSRDLVADHMHAQSSASFLSSAHERGEAVVLLERQYPDHFSLVRPAPVLDGLPGPARHAVSYLGRGPRAQRSGRVLMALSAGGDRLGTTSLADGSAKLARRIMILSGTRDVPA